MPDLIIFDCDGVLIDSEWIACRIEAEMLTAAGLPISTDEVVSRFAGMGAAAMYRALEAQHGRALPQGYEAELRRAIFGAYRSDLRPVMDMAATLDRLPQPRCVASSSDPEKLEFALGLTGLWDRFAPNVFSATMVERGKPEPDLFLYAARRMGVDPGSCLVVEDSVYGAQAGVAAGMRVVGFVGGSHCREGQAARLRAAGAGQVIDRMRDLPDVIAAAAAG